MGIFYCEKDGTITLQTKNTTYQMKTDRQGTLLHTYYGQKTDRTDKSYWISYRDRGFSGNPYGMDRAYSLDTLPQEYSCFGTGDYRISALKVKNTDGSAASALRYVSHEITEGKYSLPGLPAAYGTKEEAQTLIVTLRDCATNLKVELYYGVLEEIDLITRAIRITNDGKGSIVLQKAASLSIDWQSGAYDRLTFCGRHTMERNPERARITHGVQSVGSVRGTSSHQSNPFMMICDESATEKEGDCYGFSFVYSGEF